MSEKKDDVHQLDLFTIFDESVNEEVEVDPFRYSIISYGADYTVDSLVRRLNEDSIYIPAFQRGFVWPLETASKFVESLLLGLPVPGIFLSKDESERLIVIDGQQRLKSLQAFYNNKFKDESFELINVQKDLVGKTYDTLSSEDRRRLDDSIMHATIIQQTEPDDGSTSIYQVFERLNTRGLTLNKHEIRHSMFYGTLTSLLQDLVLNKDWRALFGTEVNTRMKEQELILRFFTLFFKHETYQKPLYKYLNLWMSENRNLEPDKLINLETIFKNTISVIHTEIGKTAFRRSGQINAAIFDSVMVGISMAMQKRKTYAKGELKKKYDGLLDHKGFLKAISSSTSDELLVKERINLSIKTFK